MQIVAPEFRRSLQEDLDDGVCDRGILEPKRALCGPVEQLFGEAKFLRGF